MSQYHQRGTYPTVITTRGVIDLTFVHDDQYKRTHAPAMAALREASFEGRCQWCGQHGLRYVGVVESAELSWIGVGEDCLDGALSGVFRRARKEAAVVAKRTSGRKNYPEAAVILDEILSGSHGDLDPRYPAFMRDIARRFERDGKLTAGQAAAVVRVYAEMIERAHARAVEMDAEREIPAEPLPVGQAQTVEGVVVKVDWQENAYGGRQVMVVKSQGWAVWGSVPRAINPSVGDRVRFVADVQASDRDPQFGFTKRPRKAEVIREDVFS